MNKFRIDLLEADRDGVHPVMSEGRFIGVSCEPFVSAAQWLSRHKDAQPGDFIDVRAGGVQVTFGRISSADGFAARRAAKPDDSDHDKDDDEDDGVYGEGEESAEEAEKRRKRKQRKVRDDLQDTTASPNEDPEDAAYHAQVRPSVRAILEAHAKATGRAPATSSRADAKYARDVVIATDETSSYDDRVAASTDAIVAAYRKMKGL